MPAFTSTQRRALQKALMVGRRATCPICDVALRVDDVAPPPDVSYVRRRVWLLCPRCRRSAAVDIKEAGRP